MKEILKIIWLSLIMLLATTLPVSAGTYTITQLTDNSYYDANPQINDSGQVVWRGGDGTDSEIFLYDGTTIIQLTDNSYADGFPQINDSGQVVWRGGESGTDIEIFLYDGTTITQLTDNSYFDTRPQINNSGQVVWQGWDGMAFQIFLYDGTITQLTDNSYPDDSPLINDSGQVVWIQGNGMDSEMLFSDTEIFLYDGTTITQLTDDSYYNYELQINNSGQVVWEVWGDGKRGEIFLYDGTTITQLTDKTYKDIAPQINDSGQVVWQGWVGSDSSDSEIFLATPASGITPPGSDVTVEPIDSDPVVGDGTGVTVEFESVTTGGETTVTSSGTGQPPPEGFKLGNPPVYYSIETTAGYSGPIQICIDYSDITYGNESKLRLFHQTDGGNWEDATDPGYPDTANKIICGTVSSLSIFSIMEADYTFKGFMPPVENPPAVNTAKAGRAIPVKWQIEDSYGTFIEKLDAVEVFFQPVNCDTSEVIGEVQDAMETSGSSGLRYDPDAEQYVFNWNTDKDMAGCYRITLELFGFDQYTADFELK